ncbi:MAG: DUF4157 domain-containing protein [Pseudonocardiaceae bacterium]
MRVHTDSKAHDSAKAVNGHAYTVGSNIVFQRDKYDPRRPMDARRWRTSSPTSCSSAVGRTPAGGGIQVSDPPTASNAKPSATPSAPCPGPRRSRAIFVQRAEEGEEEEEAAPA